MKKFFALFGLAAIAALFFGRKKSHKFTGSDEEDQVNWSEAPRTADFNWTVRPINRR